MIPESFFDELHSISRDHIEKTAGIGAAFKSPGRGAAAGAALLGSKAAVSNYVEDRKESARDIQAGHTPENQKKMKKLRRAGGAVGTASSAATGAALGGTLGKLNQWGEKNKNLEFADSVLGKGAEKVKKHIDDVATHARKHISPAVGEAVDALNKKAPGFVDVLDKEVKKKIPGLADAVKDKLPKVLRWK